MRVTIRCPEYPGMDYEPTVVEFVPAPELGDTPAIAHARMMDLLRNGKLPAVDDPLPLPFHRDTGRQVVVR